MKVIILHAQNKEYQIPQWQIDQVTERTKIYLKNPTNITEIDDFLKEIEDDLYQFSHFQTK
ncbi:hypothetical protein B4N84_18265 [Flavobacterium sp. IR1]|nr:hypothetical protein B4N84_18265 [Flavobacterium sp. IR1]